MRYSRCSLIMRCVVGLPLLAASISFSALSQTPRDTGRIAAWHDVIADALCGRGEGESMRMASSLDALDTSKPPVIWSQLQPTTVQSWLASTECEKASTTERALSRARRAALHKLQERLERARIISSLSELLPKRDSAPLVKEEWPNDVECAGCARLRRVAESVKSIVTRWPPSMNIDGQGIGELLANAADAGLLVTQLCALNSETEALQEVVANYRYFTWTRTGSRIVGTVNMLNKSTVRSACSHP